MKYLMILGAVSCLLGIALLSAPANTATETPTATVAVEETVTASGPSFHAPRGGRGLIAFIAFSGGTLLLAGALLANWHDESPVG